MNYKTLLVWYEIQSSTGFGELDKEFKKWIAIKIKNYGSI